jgi:hypothetical protein
MNDKSTPDLGKFHEFLGRALTDAGFRDRIASHNLDDRREALREITGEEPTDDQLEALDQAVHSLTYLTETFGSKAEVT